MQTERKPQELLVLFDFGNVVAEWRPERRLTAYHDLTGLSEEELGHRLVQSGFSAACDEGRYSAEEMTKELASRLEIGLTREHARALQATSFTLRDEVLAQARRTRQHHRVGLLTNNAPLLREALPEFFPELIEHFDPILFSSELGARKPAPAIFAAVEQRTHRQAAALLLIDDSRANVDAARSAGWKAILYRDPQQLADDLERVRA